MSDVLAQICARKRTETAEKKKLVSEAALLSRLAEAPAHRAFAAALRSAIAAGGYGLIAEIKKASPSRGLIREDFDPAFLARAYEAGGASCLSVLTDGPSFGGKEADLQAARAATALPVLRKDFILDPYQLLESRALGADCVLLILAALPPPRARELAAAATELGLEVLFEVHDRIELERALDLGAALIGLNNRNLKTLEVDLGVTETLAPLVPEGPLVVAESGIARPEDLDRLAQVGARAFLVGESLMREADVAAATARLLRRSLFSHLDQSGRARMVDISAKPESERVAVAGARVVMRAETLERITKGEVAKGDVFAAARLAGIMAAKHTAELIPLCHPLALSSVAVDCVPAAEKSAVEITATCRLVGRTGAEMEALVAASVAGLTIYDMCKSLDRGMVVTDLRLLKKSGGKSGSWEAGS